MLVQPTVALKSQLSCFNNYTKQVCEVAITHFGQVELQRVYIVNREE